MWCESWCSPTVSVVSLCLLWMILLCWGCHRQLWYSHGSHKSCACLQPKYCQWPLPWWICLRPWSVRPWLGCGWWTFLGCSWSRWWARSPKAPQSKASSSLSLVDGHSKCCLVNPVVHKYKISTSMQRFEGKNDSEMCGECRVFDVIVVLESCMICRVVVVFDQQKALLR